MTIYTRCGGRADRDHHPDHPDEQGLRPVRPQDPLLPGCGQVTARPAPVPTSQILYNQAIIDRIVKSAAVGHEVEVEIPEI